MISYKNLSGRSGVSFYEIGSERITVQFNTGAVYSYSYAIAGEENVEQMKALAQYGEGLNSYIKKNVNDKYDR